MPNSIPLRSVLHDVFVTLGLVYLHGLGLVALMPLWLGLQQYGWVFPLALAFLPYVLLAFLVGCALPFVTVSQARPYCPVGAGLLFGASFALQQYSVFSRAPQHRPAAHPFQSFGLSVLLVVLALVVAPTLGHALTSRHPAPPFDASGA